MLTKIEDRTIMTARQAEIKYADNYFNFVITDIGDGQDNMLGYVIYIYDHEKEMLDVPREEMEGKQVGRFMGINADKNIYVGGLVLDESNKLFQT